MSLIALELLSWLALVVRGGGDPASFEKARAHVKVRKYLIGQGVPLDAQPLPEVVAFAKEQACADALEAVSRIRNR
jgi:hypothetical protein